ncbi:hypothetical protein [Legionella drancourtii]|uniref:Periplasmic ligand-binding sensor domain protein n=1 Tax=Legionella drancourtii LLAP12 TaxID=658187 RepID=G9EIQ5_9GAMM|nr:hypothetical protein [Legionella drancourtii]EHL32823.1 hypothetical protein LDG_5061 [Legionella drancourtii LLAP12]
MQNKPEKPVAPKNPQEPVPSPKAISPSPWEFANFIVVAGTTSAAVIGVQSPVKTLLMNLSKHNTLLPNTYSGGTLSFFKALYAGTNTSIKGSAARTAYVTSTKENKPTETVLNEGLIKEENIVEDGIKPNHRVSPGYVASAALGDTAVTQIPESLSQLKKVPGLLPANFKWYTPYNAYKLMSNGFGFRYSAGLINFMCMLQFENEIARRLPINDTVKKHSLAGALSGATAAFFAYPFAAYKDYLLAQTTVNNKGLLINARSSIVIKDIINNLTNDPKKALLQVFDNTKKQLPIRMALTATIFAIISGTEKILGPEPLTKIVPEQYRPSATSPRFFAMSKTAEVRPPEASNTEAPSTPKL